MVTVVITDWMISNFPFQTKWQYSLHHDEFVFFWKSTNHKSERAAFKLGSRSYHDAHKQPLFSQLLSFPACLQLHRRAVPGQAYGVFFMDSERTRSRCQHKILLDYRERLTQPWRRCPGENLTYVRYPPIEVLEDATAWNTSAWRTWSTSKNT